MIPKSYIFPLPERRITETVRVQTTKKGRPRKVFRQGQARLSFTGKGVTAHGGMALVAAALEGFGVRRHLQELTKDMDLGVRHETCRLLEQLITLRFLGGEAVSDTRLLAEPSLLGLFDWPGVAHPATFSRRLQGFDYRHNLGLQSLVRQLSRRTEAAGAKLYAVDSTVVTVHGHQVAGAEVGYNPHKPGRCSFHPLLAVDVGGRSVVDGFLRPGSCSSNQGLDGFLRKIVAESGGKAHDIVFRLDKGLTSGPVLETIEELGCGYVAKYKLDPRVSARISRIRRWRSLGGGVFVASFRYQPLSWSKARRFVVIERHQKPKREQQPQLGLFDLMEGRYQVMVTNQKLKAENVWRLYNRGVVVEQVIKELKNDLAASSLRHQDFWASEALFLTGVIAYNLLNCLRRLALPGSLRTARLKKIALLLLHIGANVVRSGRKLMIRLARDHPMRTIFYRAMHALQAA